MYHAMALVAGEGTPGFRDGEFTEAFFKQPLGMAISPDGNRLYVVDNGNNRIRLIRLDQSNEVSTLAGQDKAGNQDGPLSSAQFDQPGAIAYLPEDRLVVADNGNKLLRLIDLKSGMVSTLAGGVNPALAEGPATQVSMVGIRDMVYLPAADSVLFSQPLANSLKRLDMKTGMVSKVLSSHAEMPQPSALCVVGNKIYVADRVLSRIVQVEWKGGAEPAVGLLSETGSTVISLAGSDKVLYAIEGGVTNPLERILPVRAPVTFTSVWGDELAVPGEYLPSFIHVEAASPVGFIADPGDETRFYLVNPYLHIVTTLRDLSGETGGGGDYWNPNAVNDFNVPGKKPPRTYRILFVGDSRSNMIVDYSRAMPFNSQLHSRYPRQLGISKQMELELNTRAALEDAPYNFEVMSCPRSASFPLFLWPTYQVPDTVRLNDIDLVVILQVPVQINHSPFLAYFERPMTSEGIPANEIDGEFLTRPYKERIPDGAPKRFVEKCMARKWARLKGDGVAFNKGLTGEPELRDELVDMYGKPMDLLKKELVGMRTSNGNPVSLVLCFTSSGWFAGCSGEEELWKALTHKYDIPLLNLGREMNALRISYYPISEFGNANHFNLNGHMFFGRLMAHSLIWEGLVPWSKPDDRPKR